MAIAQGFERTAICALALLATGTGMAVTGWYSRYGPPPDPPASAVRQAQAGSTRLADGVGGSSPRLAEPRPLPFSPPVRVGIPAIGVHATGIPLRDLRPRGVLPRSRAATPAPGGRRPRGAGRGRAAR